MEIEYTFYFIRHAFSCANLSKKKATSSSPFSLARKIKYTYYQLLKDPHLANWGILSAAKLRKDYTELIETKRIDNFFCSPLIRTWETAYLLFGSEYIKKFKIAPYVKENAMGPANNAYPYIKNKERFYDFIKYSTEVNMALKIIKNEVKPLKTRYSKIFDKYELPINNKFVLPEYDGDEKKKYRGIYDKSDLNDFICWYINNFKKNTRVICVTHSHSIRNLLKKLIPKRFKNNIDNKNSFNIKKHNAYCYEVKFKIITNKSNDNLSEKLVSIQLYNKGVFIPEKQQTDGLRFACNGLCEISEYGCRLNNESGNIKMIGKMINDL